MRYTIKDDILDSFKIADNCHAETDKSNSRKKADSQKTNVHTGFELILV